MLNIRKFFEGIGLVPKTTTTIDTMGELEVISGTGKLQYHNGTTVSPAVTEAHTATLTNKSIDADTNTITNIENADIKAAAAIDATKIADGSVTSAEFQFINTLTSNAQTQLNNKLSATLTDAHIFVGNGSNVATDVAVSGDITLANTGNMQIATGVIVNADINASAAIDASKIADGTVSSAEFQFINSLTSNAQTQINTKISASSTDTLTNKTIDGDDNTVQDLALTSLKTNITDASKFLVRNASGVVISNTKAVPTGVVVGDTDTQTLTNKTLTSPTLTTPTTDIVTWDDQGSTPSNPASGFYKTYFKTDGKLYKLTSGGVESEVGTDGGLCSSTPSSAKTTDYAVLSTDNGKTIIVDTTSAVVIITLPAPTANFKVTIKDYVGTAATNNIRVYPNALEKIDNFYGFDSLNTNYMAVSYHSNGTDWYRVADFTTTAIPTSLARALFGGGSSSGGDSLVIDYVTIASTGNATNFGNLTDARYGLGSCASTTRGLWAGGNGLDNIIDYVTIATTGNATDFGDLTVARRGVGGCSNSTRGLFGGGTTGDVIDYVTIASTGNATDFGDLTVSRRNAGSCASTTRGLWAGGDSNSVVIDYVTIASTGNATNFGNLTVGGELPAGASNATRGLFGGRFNAGANNTIDYVTIASTGNATDFGDLSVTRYGAGGAANPIRALFGGGNTGSQSNVIDYVTIASTGNATDFGDLTVARDTLGGCSNAHGGL